ncbi:hypothetical protein IEO70_10775 [Bacillus sp. AGMB 02131]|uniref:Uncharacterized protein n=1 Tax=Peribacillus faecalis TaxID=2772559 RepID=A0A927HCW8_9BACI|nr:hypothetical protein [Peribacillus faecalis]MBD3108848.1 hypothetical protein [Peribacillus faecalis]
MKNVRGIVLSEDETVIREYEASYIANPKSEGYVIATNRRLIFTGSSKSTLGSSIILRDTKIDSISGVSGGLTHKKSLLSIVIGAIIALFGLTFFESAFNISVLLLGIGGFLIYKGFNASGVQMYLLIMSSDSTPAINVSVEASRGFFSRITSNDAFLTVAAAGPGRNTEQMIREISALIQDIQIMGDLAIDKWKNSNYEDRPLKKTSGLAPKEPDSESVVPEYCRCKTPNVTGAEYCVECGGKIQMPQTNIFG